jgi:hypothetical protein
MKNCPFGYPMNFFQAHRPLLLGISQSGERQGHATSVHGENEHEHYFATGFS